MCSGDQIMADTHVFEKAGLGKAPYTFIKLATDADRAGEQREREANGQTFTTNYCTSCDYCSTAIHNTYWLRSADGNEFKVGCDCIRKAGDRGLIKIVAAHESGARKRKAVQKKASAKQQRAFLVGRFFDGDFDSFLAGKPHPYGWENKTAFDYVQYCAQNPTFMGKAADALLAQAAKSVGGVDA
jgi:hypothetical protein